MGRTSVATLARLERDRRAFRLRAQGMPWAEVARECGFNRTASAFAAVQALIKRETHDSVETSRAIQLERLEVLWGSIYLAAVSPGLAMIAAAKNGEPRPPSQKDAHDMCAKLLDRLADIQGTKAPVKLAGPTGGPIENRVDVIHWRPDEAFMVQYARVLNDAGLIEEPLLGPSAFPEPRRVGPGDEVP